MLNTSKKFTGNSRNYKERGEEVGTAVKVDVTRQNHSLFVVPDQARSSAVKSRVESWQFQATSNLNALTSMVLHSVACIYI